MKEIVERGATAVVLHLYLPDASSSLGAGRTGVGPSTTGLVIALIRPGDAGPVAYTSAGGAIEPIATLGAWVAPTEGRCRWREIDAALLPGWYELHLPNSWFDATGDRRSVEGMVWGPAGVLPTPFQIQLCDPLRGVGSPSRLDAAISTRADAAAYSPARAGRLDLLDVAVSTRGDATAANQTTLLNRLGPFSGGSLNSVFGFLRAALRKDAGLTPPDVQGAFDNTTDSLEAQAGRGTAVGLSATERAAIAAAVLDLVDGVEPGETPRQTLRLLRAVCVGKSTGFPDGPVAFRDRSDSKNRVVATVDGQGNRQTVSTDGT